MHTLPEHVWGHRSGTDERTIPSLHADLGGCPELMQLQSWNNYRVLSPFNCLSRRVHSLFHFPGITKHLSLFPGIPLFLESLFFFLKTMFACLIHFVGDTSIWCHLMLAFSPLYLAVYWNGACYMMVLLDSDWECCIFSCYFPCWFGQSLALALMGEGINGILEKPPGALPLVFVSKFIQSFTRGQTLLSWQ